MTRTPETAAASEQPFVSIVIPVRNEARFIEAALAGVLAQDYPRHRMEVIVADGASTDGTPEIVRRIAAEHPAVRLVDNPGKFVSSGLNRAIEAARGDIIVRVDGHGEYPADYVRRVVALREQTGAANAGGVLVPVGKTYLQRSICAALGGPGVGGFAMKARGESDEVRVRDVDAVNGGCWRRQALLDAGGFSEEMVRNQDDELSFRLRKAGGRIVQSSAIRFSYVVRDRWSRLFRQYLQYGYWKVRVVRKHPGQASLRHLGPVVIVALLAAGLLMGPFHPLAAAPALAYLAAAAGTGLLASLRSGAGVGLWPGATFAMVVMHVAYGIGSLMGLLGLAGGRRMDGWFSRLSR